MGYAGPGGRRSGRLADFVRAGALAAILLPAMADRADAYTAAGDRLFPATILLPQIAPSDEFYIRTTTQQPASGSRLTNPSAVYNKTITERLSVGVEDGYNWLSQAGGATFTGWQNLQTRVKYLAILDPVDEFLLSAGVNREWGDTGAPRIGASAIGATAPSLTLGKGMGELGPDYLRPFAVAALLGYQVGDAAPRPDVWQAGIALEYSVPYLESKVESVALPALIRDMTPMVEILFTAPSGNSYGKKAQLSIAPGVSYAGEGWELGIEALVPATRATGVGLGVAAQLHFALDYLFAGSLLGMPIFSAE
ncbi:MAG TPA: hypothetical protein VN980_19430 [Alphaproteobacteria bacterium]|nr:hypothetical protein [Alphaproteobacteria bacterium]